MSHLKGFLTFAGVTVLVGTAITGLFHVLMRIASLLVPNAAVQWIPYIYIFNFIVAISLVWGGWRFGKFFLWRVFRKAKT